MHHFACKVSSALSSPFHHSHTAALSSVAMSPDSAVAHLWSPEALSTPVTLKPLHRWATGAYRRQSWEMASCTSALPSWKKRQSWHVAPGQQAGLMGDHEDRAHSGPQDLGFRNKQLCHPACSRAPNGTTTQGSPARDEVKKGKRASTAPLLVEARRKAKPKGTRRQSSMLS